jgi:hypothetical protein
VDTLILSMLLREGVPWGASSEVSGEFCESAVAMVRETSKPVAEVARDLGINAGGRRSGRGRPGLAVGCGRGPR